VRPVRRAAARRAGQAADGGTRRSVQDGTAVTSAVTNDTVCPLPGSRDSQRCGKPVAQGRNVDDRQQCRDERHEERQGVEEHARTISLPLRNRSTATRRGVTIGTPTRSGKSKRPKRKTPGSIIHGGAGGPAERPGRCGRGRARLFAGGELAGKGVLHVDPAVRPLAQEVGEPDGRLAPGPGRPDDEAVREAPRQRMAPLLPRRRMLAKIRLRCSIPALA